MRITVESNYNDTIVSATVDLADTEASGEECEWLAKIFSHLVHEGILGTKE